MQPKVTLGGKEYDLFPPRRKIEIVEVRASAGSGQRHRAALTALGRAARSLWLLRSAVSEDGPPSLVHREPLYQGDPVAYGAEVYEVLAAHYGAAEIDEAAALAWLWWMSPETLAGIPTAEAIDEATDFIDPRVPTGKEKDAGRKD